jgi:ABC-2 type transport system permease protein
VEHNTRIVDFMDVSLAVVSVVVAAFAAALVGGEFVRRTVGLDYLAVPRRVPVLAAKVSAFAGVGAVLGLLSALLATVVAAPIALGRDVVLDGPGDAVLRVLAVTAAVAALSALGAAVGVLVPHPAVAVGAVIGWQIVEMLLGTALGIGDYLPIRLVTTVAHLGGTVPLPVAFGLLCLYVAGAVGVALLVGRRRDLA